MLYNTGTDAPPPPLLTDKDLKDFLKVVKNIIQACQDPLLLRACKSQVFADLHLVMGLELFQQKNAAVMEGERT